ncbi:hypothetical protein B1H10_00245 [candidate division KSB1 bacterium 4484_188]|nr:MAG: hypothetical protein B1H10_00245 [candidate division KSB1 bacterium 4484_188]
MSILAVSGDLIEIPVTFALQRQMGSGNLQVEIMPESDMVRGLALGKLPMALISPFAYAKIEGKIRIVEDLIISSTNFGRNALLFFQHNLPAIKSVFYSKKDDYDMYRFLGKIVLREFLDVDTKWQEVREKLQPPDDLKKYPVIFCSGNDALSILSRSDVFLDLTEEWSIKNDLPLVHKILVVSSNFTGREQIEIVKNACRKTLENLDRVFSAKTFPDFVDPSFLFKLIKDNYRYESASDTWESLETFLQYIFYYGESEFLPDLKMF